MIKSAPLWHKSGRSQTHSFPSKTRCKNTALNIELSKLASADIDNIHDYIAQDNPTAAGQTVARLFQSIRYLETFPLLSRVGRVDGTRELTVPGLPYIIVLEIPNETDIIILRVFHTSMRWPPKLR